MKKKISMMLPGLLLMVCLATAQQQPPPNGRPPGPPPPPAEHSKQVSAKLEKDLALSKEQTEKVAAAYQSFFTGMEKIRGKMPPPPPPPPMPPGKRKSADSLSMIRNAAIKKVLTASQFTKYQEVEKTMRPQRPQRPQGPPPAEPKQ